MRILLIQPPSNIGFIDRVYMHEPLALEYLGAGLKIDGHEVLLHDGRVDPEITAAAEEFCPHLVGLTSYTSQVPSVINLAGKLKNLACRPLVVVVGHHATVRPADFNIGAIDLIVVGEGVKALREIARELAAKQDFESIPGLAIPGEALKFTLKRPHPELDELPLPDRSLSARYRDRYFSEWLRPLASIRTSLGCIGRCTFCALWSITEGKYLRRDPGKVVGELMAIEEKNVFFCDDESMCDVGRMRQLAELIAENNIRKHYFLYARVDTIVRHPDLFAQWRNIGLRQVFVGMESYSDTHLQEMKKGITVAQQEEAIHVLKKLKILPYASFMVDPDFSREDFRSLKACVRRLKLNHASFSILTPLPGTVLFDQNRQDLPTHRPDLFDFIHTVLPTRLPLEEFYAEFANLWQYAVPPHRAIKTFLHYDPRRIPQVLRLLREAMKAMRRGYLDHQEIIGYNARYDENS